MGEAIAILAVLVSAMAITVAVAAVVIVLRRTDESRGDGIGAARTAQLERRTAQLGQRLEVLEHEIDAGARGTGSESHGDDGMIRAPGAAITHVGLVRFDAFPDAGGAQSFALALLDDEGDGVVLTSLHSRQTTRVYIRDIRRGVSDAPLSEEEDQALREAGIER